MLKPFKWIGSLYGVAWLWIINERSKSFGYGGNDFPGREHSPFEGRITARLVYSLTRLDLTKGENMLLFVLCSEAVESNLVKLETSHKVRLSPTVEVLCARLTAESQDSQWSEHSQRRTVFVQVYTYLMPWRTLTLSWRMSIRELILIGKIKCELSRDFFSSCFPLSISFSLSLKFFQYLALFICADLWIFLLVFS